MADVLAFSAWASAFIGGASAAIAARVHRAHVARYKALKGTWQGHHTLADMPASSLADHLLERLARFDMTYRKGKAFSGIERLAKYGQLRLSQELLQAGFGEMNVHAASVWRLYMGLVGAGLGCLIGLMFSPAAACLGLAVGGLLGWASLSQALRKVKAERTFYLEKHLSEAIEVICLGLRAGLSFERSLELYCDNFPSRMSRELAHAQQMWHTGLLTRESALRTLSASYDSHIFSRMIDSIVRSLRFGSPLATSLEELAQEARAAHRASVEEKVMKAPVKMMVPIGVCILPSMLLLVMGPIMLELIEGF